MPAPILITKLYIPPTRAELVHRPGLIERLNNGLDRKLTLISAPAGFGKTTLVSYWLENLRQDKEIHRQPIQVAWLSLDEEDNDPVRFLTYFITALNQIKEIDADLGQGALSMLQSPQPPPVNTVLISLINDLAIISDKIVFVLDDYHLIETEPIHQALVFLIENLPPQLHLVIATRQDPPLSLGRLRARAQMTELRAADLRFSESEAADFLNQVMGLNLSPEDIAELETRTEGWIAGLQLAAISMRGWDAADRFIQSFTGSNRLVLDYLIEEVLSQQSANVQNFLLQTAILDSFNSSLCNAVTGQEDGQAILEMLERINLFIVPLDNERKWYRYHHLFADLLHQKARQTDLEQLPSLHRRASEWYANEGQASNAIRHALAAEDYDRAADLIELAWPSWRGPVELLTWLDWVKGLPDELVRFRPVLSVAVAQALLNAGQLEAANARLLDTERWLAPKEDQPNDPTMQMVVVDEAQWSVLPISLATVRAYHAQAIGNIPGTLQYTQRVLDLLPDGNHPLRGPISMLLGLACWASGDLEAAYKNFSAGSAMMDIQSMISAAFVLAEMKIELSYLQAATTICQSAIKLGKEHDEPILQGLEDVYSVLSNLHRERGDLEAAAQALVTSKELGKKVLIPDWKYRWCIAQARLHETLGNHSEALEFLEDAERLYVRTPIPNVQPIAAIKARIWVRQDRLAEAQDWVVDQGLSVDDELSFLRAFDHITLTRTLIAQYKNSRDDDSIHNAMGLAGRLLQAAEKGKRIRSVIEILILQALAHEAQGDTPSALKPLERALTLAESEGFIRTFVDEGQPMASLLYEALKREIAPEYVQRLLTAFPVTESQGATSTESLLDQSELIEPLSEREIEVLQLLAKGLTNQAVADRLVLSIHTVKAHTRSIYSKLAVNNRTQAVDRARILGVLPPN